jgi:hypothetical protein
MGKAGFCGIDTHCFGKRRIKMKISISLKTLLIMQGLLVLSLIPMDIFQPQIGVYYMIPLYSWCWIYSYSELNKNKDD